MERGFTIRSIYLYMVSLVTLLMLVFGLIFFVNSAIRLAMPTDYTYYRTIMDIEREYLDAGLPFPGIPELEQIRDQRMTEDILLNRNFRLRETVGALAVWLIPLPFYLYHWNKIKKEYIPKEDEK